MDNVPNKSTGDFLAATEYNPSQDELENAVTDSAQTLGGDRFQLSRAMSINAGGADYYGITGGPTAYVASSLGSLRSPPAYYQGQRVRGRVPTTNGSSPTINVGAVGVVSILKEDGVTALGGGEMTTGVDFELRYDTTAGAFLLKSPAPDATQSSKGLVFLGDQRIILSNNATDPTNDIDFTVGRFTFDDGSGQAISNAYTKQLDATFVAGNNQGMLDTGTVANDWYYLFAIYSSAAGVSDYLASASYSSPTLPTTPIVYNKKRYIGAIIRDTGAILGFHQYHKTFRYDERIQDEDNSSPGQSAVIWQLTTPDSIETEAIIVCAASRSGATVYALITSPDETDIAPSATYFDLYINSQNTMIHNEMRVKTDSSGQIRYRFSQINVSSFTIQTLGWTDFNLED